MSFQSFIKFILKIAYSVSSRVIRKYTKLQPYTVNELIPKCES